MKELSIEEKAKRYDKAIKIAKEINNEQRAQPFNVMIRVFPELKDEDERIREEIIKYIKIGTYRKDWISWLEKQGVQDNAEDIDILHRFSFYSYKDEPNVLYLSGLYVNEEYRNKGIGTKILKVADEVAKSLDCHAIRLKTKKDSNAERLYQTHGYNSLANEEKDEIWLEKQGEQKPYGQREECFDCQFNYAGECKGSCAMKRSEQKPADKVEPKFKVKYAGSEYNVLEVKDIAGVTYYGIEDEPNHIDYVLPDNCERVGGYSIKENGSPYPTKPAVFSEQNSAWSEDDENVLEDIEEAIIKYWHGDTQDILLDWLKSLKERYTWKPSDEQIKALKDVREGVFRFGILESLYNDLMKLKG